MPPVGRGPCARETCCKVVSVAVNRTYTEAVRQLTRQSNSAANGAAT